MEQKTGFLTFTLPEDFVEGFKEQEVSWGFQNESGFSLGELTFLTKYSRVKEDGTKERWWEVVRRVVEGTFTTLKNHCTDNNIEFDEDYHQELAEKMYERIFDMRFLPPGRGLFSMGTSLIHEHGLGISANNCAALTTANMDEDPVTPFAFLMDLSMLGVGVGFDVYGAGKAPVYTPTDQTRTVTVTDSRAGWVRSTALLLGSYLKPNRPQYVFDYSKVRGKGEPIKTFGGVSSGPEPLIKLHEKIRELFDSHTETYISSRLIGDVMNLIGKCIVSGNVRRTAEVMFGSKDDDDFLSLKDYTLAENVQRTGMDGWAYTSNNSVMLSEGEDISFEGYSNMVAMNGEPGLFWIDKARKYGRTIDPPNYKDMEVVSSNPCLEQSLHDMEVCCLVESFPYRHESLEDYLETLEVAFLYSKAVTLLPIHWGVTSEIIKRNRRIGTSMSGVVQFLEDKGEDELIRWMDEGYHRVQYADDIYSSYYGINHSIKTTSIKPSGTVSLLTGSTPGVHWPVATTYIRRMRLSWGDPVLEVLGEANYRIEPAYGEPDVTAVVEIPVRIDAARDEKEVSVKEKVHLSALAQKYWADNQVSTTIPFHPRNYYEKPSDALSGNAKYRSEVDDLTDALEEYEPHMKAISCLPIDPNSYPQLPYESITDKQYEEEVSRLLPVDLDSLYDELSDAESEQGCTNDKCQI